MGAERDGRDAEAALGGRWSASGAVKEGLGIDELL
jgi:hypothetical protein